MRLNIFIADPQKVDSSSNLNKVLLFNFFSFRNTKSCKLFQALYGQFVVNFDMEANNPEREALNHLYGKICVYVFIKKTHAKLCHLFCSFVSALLELAVSIMNISPCIFTFYFYFLCFILELHCGVVISRKTYLVYLFWSGICPPCIQLYTDSSRMTRRKGHMYQNSYKDLEYIGLLKEKKCLA